VLDALVAALPRGDLALLAAGGLLYSFGVAAHLARRLRYHRALWHLLVVAATGCHYVVVLRLAAAGRVVS
jgi:hemolysin III